MGTSRARLRNLSTLLGGALLVSVPATAASAAATGPTIVISNLTSGQTVSGQVTVDATVQSTPGAPVTAVTFAISNGSYVEQQTVTAQPGQCDTSCTLSWTADTTAVRTYGSIAMPIPVLPDGKGYDVSAQTSTSAGSALTDVPVVLDNHRPTVSPAPGSDMQGSRIVALGNQSASMGVTATVSPTAAAGTSVSTVEFELPGIPQIAPIRFSQAAGGGSAWTMTEDTSALPAGLYEGAIVATDSNGMVNPLLPAVMVVDHGFKLTAPAGNVISPAWGASDFGYAYPSNPVCGNIQPWAGLAQSQLYVDGTLWSTADLTQVSAVQLSASSCEMPVAGSLQKVTPLPFGHHTLTYVVTDEAGVQEKATQDVTVALPLAASWPTAPITLTEGSTLHLAPAVTAPDGFSKLQAWTIAYNGTTLASGSYPTRPSLTWATPAKQLVNGKLTLTSVSDSGLTSTDSVTVSGAWPSATFLNASATSVARGAWVKLTATPWQKVADAWSNADKVAGKTTIQWQGGANWYNGPSVSTSPAGVWVHAESSECYRAVWSPATGTTDLGSTSAPVCITVKP